MRYGRPPTVWKPPPRLGTKGQIESSIVTLTPSVAGAFVIINKMFKVIRLKLWPKYKYQWRSKILSPFNACGLSEAFKASSIFSF